MNETKIKHLEFIQLVITRMNVNSFLIKGWTVTLVAALFALAAKDSNIAYVTITYISTPILWLLDGYYLSQERQYRALYNTVSRKTETQIDFDMNAKPYSTNRSSWLGSVFSSVLVIFYGVLIGLTLTIMIIIN